MRNVTLVLFLLGLFILSSCHRRQGCPTYGKAENKIEKRG